MFRHVKSGEGANVRPCVMRRRLFHVLPCVPASFRVKPCQPFSHRFRRLVLVSLLVDLLPPSLRGSKPAPVTSESLNSLFLSLQSVAKGFGGFLPIIAAQRARAVWIRPVTASTSSACKVHTPILSREAMTSFMSLSSSALLRFFCCVTE
jgi:hypothetical protein